MKQNFIAAIFILTIMAMGNPGNLFAGCVTVENDLKFNICAEYQGAKYQIPFSFFQHDTGFYWKADAVAAKQIQSGDNCISVANDLNLKFSCADYQGVGYAFVLNYAAYPNDASGLYWKMDISTFSTSYAIADTGQSKCYNATSEISCPASGAAFYGQDAQYAGNQPTYTLSSDGLTVKDNNTGLIWQSSPDTNNDASITASDKKTLTNAQAYPATLNAKKFGGFSDWRLPTIKELYSLIKFNGTDPSGVTGNDTSGLTPFIDTGYFKFAYGQTSAGERIIDSQYASSNLYVGNTANDGGSTLFGVNFADGRIKGYGLTMPGGGSEKTFFVICVRGNTAYGINNFTDNGDNTVTDKATGLIWSKNDSGSGMNWSDALAYVQTKNAQKYLGHNDWRLPNAKELQGIVDYTRSPDKTNSAAINPMFSCTKIKNEAGKDDYPFYWTGTTHAASNGMGQYAAYVAFGRAMGYMNNSWVDVHGAGAQRSDPKSGNPADYPTGHGPQGDAIRIYNYVRLVRGGI